MSDETTPTTPADDATPAVEPTVEPVAEAAAAPVVVPAETVEPATPSPAETAEYAEAATEQAAEAPSEAVAEPAPVSEPAPKPAKKPRAKKAAAPVADAEPKVPDAAVAGADAPAEPAANKKKWYAIKVQSGREDSIKAAVLRKVRIEGLEEFFGRIEIPFEEVSEKKAVKVKDKKTGETSYQEKKVTRKKKKFQGYLFVELEFNDRILYLFRETSGVGDFLNLRHKPGQPPTPEPMPDHEVQSMLTGVAVKDPSKPKKVKIDFEKGDKVRIKEGSFANQEGEVKVITEPKDPADVPKIIVIVTLWGRPVDVDLDASQVEKV